MSPNDRSVNQLPTFPLCGYYLADPPVDEDGTGAWVEAPDVAQATYLAALLYGQLWNGAFTHAAYLDPMTGKACRVDVPDVSFLPQVRQLIRKS
jgi:hypothetical protein